MACGLYGAKLVFESMLAYRQLDTYEQISVKLKFWSNSFHLNEWEIDD